jgi:3-hydroxyisobutyrate dehydrogenase
VIGTGRMGAAMAATIHGAGHDVVVWNRDAGKSSSLADRLGCQVAPSAATAAASAEIVITSLADDSAVETVYLGEDGVVQGIGIGSVAVDTSTIDPETVKKVGAAVDATGAGFIDCPVSGSVSTVESGALTVMAGGDPDLIDRARPVLEAIAGRIVHVGQRGAGAATKLAVNGLVHALDVALSEAVVLAERAGVERSVAYEVFANGAAGAPFVQYKRPAFEAPETAPVAFSLHLMAKDLELITGLGRKVGAPLAQAEANLELVDRAIEAGHGDADMSAIAVYLRKKAG